MMEAERTPTMIEAAELILDVSRAIDRHEAEYAALRARQRAETSALLAQVDRLTRINDSS